MSDAESGVAYRYCMCCGTVLEPDTNGPCECGRPSAMIGLMKRRVIPMREVPEYQWKLAKSTAAVSTAALLIIAALMIALVKVIAP